jgi:hypothetical protein
MPVGKSSELCFRINRPAQLKSQVHKTHSYCLHLFSSTLPAYAQHTHHLSSCSGESVRLNLAALHVFPKADIDRISLYYRTAKDRPGERHILSQKPPSG